MMYGAISAAACFAACNSDKKGAAESESAFEVTCDEFADLQVLRYQIPGFEELSAQQKELAYY
jgi:dipeptidyl-peptidase-3